MEKKNNRVGFIFCADLFTISAFTVFGGCYYFSLQPSASCVYLPYLYYGELLPLKVGLFLPLPLLLPLSSGSSSIDRGLRKLKDMREKESHEKYRKQGPERKGERKANSRLLLLFFFSHFSASSRKLTFPPVPRSSLKLLDRKETH